MAHLITQGHTLLDLRRDGPPPESNLHTWDWDPLLVCLMLETLPETVSKEVIISQTMPKWWRQFVFAIRTCLTIRQAGISTSPRIKGMFAKCNFSRLFLLKLGQMTKPYKSIASAMAREFFPCRYIWDARSWWWAVRVCSLMGKKCGQSSKHKSQNLKFFSQAQESSLALHSKQNGGLQSLLGLWTNSK